MCRPFALRSPDSQGPNADHPAYRVLGTEPSDRRIHAPTRPRASRCYGLRQGLVIDFDCLALVHFTVACG